MSGTMVSQSRSVTSRVVSKLADAEGVDVYDVPALFDSVDPDALESLVAESSASANVTVEFSHAGYRVTIDDGRVSIDPLSTDR